MLMSIIGGLALVGFSLVGLVIASLRNLRRHL